MACTAGVCVPALRVIDPLRTGSTREGLRGRRQTRCGRRGVTPHSTMPKMLFSTRGIYKFKNLLRTRRQPKPLDVLLGRKRQRDVLQVVRRASHSAAPGSTEAKRQKTSLRKLLRDKQCLAAFKSFLQSEFSAENIEFWLACQEYKTTSPCRRTLTAAKIYQTFLHTDAEKEINIDHHTREKIKRALLEPDLLCFHEAEEQVYRLMESDSCPRFLHSQAYRSLRNWPGGPHC